MAVAARGADRQVETEAPMELANPPVAVEEAEGREAFHLVRALVLGMSPILLEVAWEAASMSARPWRPWARASREEFFVLAALRTPPHDCLAEEA